MDISAILPVNMGNDSSSLNDDFSAQTPAGDNIFSKPLGARTMFRTPTNGLVCVSFIFDPKKKYGEDHHMASVTSDWMADLRDALTKHLLDESDIAPKTKNLEETIWDQLTTALPKETLAKNLFTDKKTFQTYTDMLKATVTKNFNEEKILTEKLRTEAYSFSFEVAIDAYPQQLAGKSEPPSGEKTGVLTFHIEGIPDGKMPMPQKLPEEGSDDPNRKSKKRKTPEPTANDKSKDNKEADKLIEELALTEFYKRAHLVKEKHFPLTASQFFEASNRWFSSVVSRRAAKLEKDRNRNPLYH